MKKIMIVCSTTFYEKIKTISEYLLKNNYEIVYPNGYNEEEKHPKTQEELTNQYKSFYNESREKIKRVDAILVLNFDKAKDNITLKNYIGPSTFLEMYEAFMQNKKIYVYTSLPDETFLLYDDIKAINPICLNEKIENIKESKV